MPCWGFGVTVAAPGAGMELLRNWGCSGGMSEYGWSFGVTVVAPGAFEEPGMLWGHPRGWPGVLG